MNILERIDYGFFERISYFNELLPFTKIKIIMFFSMGIIATISFILIFKFKFPNIKNKYFILPTILFLTSGIILSYLSFPPNNYLMIYPKIKDSQKIYKYGINEKETLLLPAFKLMDINNEGRRSSEN